MTNSPQGKELQRALETDDPKELQRALETDDPIEALLRSGGPQSIEELRSLMGAAAKVGNADAPQTSTAAWDIPITNGVSANIFAPKEGRAWPILVYYHGGGWVSGASKQHEKLLRRFAERGFLTISIDYRLAPEFPFPAAFMDCVTGYKWAVSNGNVFGGNPSRIAIAGDSAGANLAAAVLNEIAPDENRPKAACFIYGAFDLGALELEAHTQVGRGNGMVLEAYLGDDRNSMLRDPRVSPIYGALDFPPSYLVVGDKDSLQPQSVDLFEELSRRDIACEISIAAGMPHGFIQMEHFPEAIDEIDRMSDFMLKHMPIPKI